MHQKVQKALHKARDYIKLARVELIIIAAALAFDLFTKAILAGVSRQIIPNFFYITYTHNPNAAFGSTFGLDNIFREGAAGNAAFFFTIFAAAAIAFGIIYMLYRDKKNQRFFAVTAGILSGAAFLLFLLYIALPRPPLMSFFITLTIVAVAGFSIMLYRARGKTGSVFLVRVGLALIIGGALGNLFDRMFLGYVRDFIEFVYFGRDLGFLGESFPIFNIADAALTVGVVVFGIGYIKGEVKKKPKEEAAANAADDGDYRDKDSDE